MSRRVRVRTVAAVKGGRPVAATSGDHRSGPTSPPGPVAPARVEANTQSRYGALVRAPRGLRDVLKAGQLQRLIERAEQLRAAELELRAEREALVNELRGAGASWDSVGWVLGCTGEAARLRYGRRRSS